MIIYDPEKDWTGYIFLLPKDQFATIRAYYHLPPSP